MFPGWPRAPQCPSGLRSSVGVPLRCAGCQGLLEGLPSRRECVGLRKQSAAWELPLRAGPSDRLIRESLSDSGPAAEQEGIPAHWGRTEPARRPPSFLPWSWARKNLPPVVPSGDSKIQCKPEFSIRPEGKRSGRETLRPLLLWEELLSPGCWWLTSQHEDALVAGAQQPPCLLYKTD